MDATRGQIERGDRFIICPCCGSPMACKWLGPVTIIYCLCGLFFDLPPNKFVRHTIAADDPKLFEPPF